jgi:hypothetical protein
MNMNTAMSRSRMLIHIYMMNTISMSIGQKIRLENRIPIGTSIAQLGMFIHTCPTCTTSTVTRHAYPG